MRRLFPLAFLAVVWSPTLVAACSPALDKAIAKSAIDAALAGCIAENPGEDESALKEICKWTDELAPLVKELIGKQKKGLVKHDAAKVSAPAPAKCPDPPAAPKPADAGAKG